MQVMISNLLNRFERGLLTRRELVQALTMLAATSGVTSTARAQKAGIQGAKIDHSGRGRFSFSPSQEPAGLVDHFAIGVEKFDRQVVTRQLKAGLLRKTTWTPGFISKTQKE